MSLVESALDGESDEEDLLEDQVKNMAHPSVALIGAAQ